MKAEVYVKEIEFKNGKRLPLASNAIVVFVGSNNAGKSQTLREINDIAKVPNQRNCLIVNGLTFIRQGTEDEFLARIEVHRKNDAYHFIENEYSVSSDSEQSLRQYWANFDSPQSPGSRARINRYLVNYLTTNERLSLVNPPKSINYLTEFPKHPIHQLAINDNKETLFSDNFKRAFGEDVIANRLAGSIVTLHVGHKPSYTVEHDRVSMKYQQELATLGMLHEQGDGMKSFAGVFLGLFIEDNSINLIDEPEAFLHPPQASLLGQMIAKNLENDKQIFIATHSEHFLKGLLDHAGDRLVIVRIQRDGTSNKINVLNNTEIQSIWSDSLLRHSNILDGLFHNKVVLCESDSDNRFFSAIAASIVEKENLSAKDILFVQSGGKHRFPVVIKALNKLEVPLIIIGDFDLYNNEEPLKTIYEEMGGEWNDIKTDVKIVKQSVDQKRPELETTDLKQSIDNLFAGVTERIMPEAIIKKIEKELKKSSPWGQAKSSGRAYLSSGDPTTSFEKAQKFLKLKGIHILDVGEIEAFDKTIGGVHGPKWVNEVLAKDIVTVPELQSARDLRV
ncbi:AAA family ATPase [Mucilaginibacter sp.]|uniref:ATP-dependent nuclease n=1 Tax=Mucilaginibacter sp. TaxID=1882438 RepID=UPI003266FC0D